MYIAIYNLQSILKHVNTHERKQYHPSNHSSYEEESTVRLLAHLLVDEPEVCHGGGVEVRPLGDLHIVHPVVPAATQRHIAVSSGVYAERSRKRK